jgi:hypothetical protein
MVWSCMDLSASQCGATCIVAPHGVGLRGLQRFTVWGYMYYSASRCGANCSVALHGVGLNVS